MIDYRRWALWESAEELQNAQQTMTPIRKNTHESSTEWH
jgi:hypothetical protein